ncbi:glycosyltransferase family 1 protein [Patescibacteria group bacterium]|nr:glycosyltransferase family 1 protein [Patescibacteria group bacterium]
MRIGIDASRANLKEKTGVEWYGYHLILELAKIDKKNIYRLYTWEPLRGDLAKLPDNFKSVIVPLRKFWTYTALPFELRKHPVDRLFVPSHIVPPVHPKKTITTIHDLGFRHFPKSYSKYHFLNLHVGTRLSARWASNIIVPSRDVAEDVHNYYKVPEEKVTEVPNGYDTDMFKDVTAAKVVEVMKHHGVSDPYILFIGRLEARKNVTRLLEAFYRLRDSGLFGGQLVLVGNPGIGYDEIRQMINKRKGQESVIHTGYVSNEDRAALLRGARALAFPSLFEGFGVPILEGFAADTPVLTSNRGATAEVAGDAALLVNPESVTEIHQGLERLLSDSALTKKLVARGQERLKSYSWKKTAKHVHEIITS